jgi:hypothetical protein
MADRGLVAETVAALGAGAAMGSLIPRDRARPARGADLRRTGSCFA